MDVDALLCVLVGMSDVWVWGCGVWVWSVCGGVVSMCVCVWNVWV